MVKLIAALLLALGLTTGAFSQSIHIKKGPLTDALAIIEKETGWTFNFNPQVIESISIDEIAELSIKNQSVALQALLQTTALDFEIKNNVVILLPPEKKHYRICGNLSDNTENTPLAFAHVYLNDYQGCLTDDNGYFEFDKKAFKNEEITLSYLGFKDKKVLVSAFNFGCQDLDLTHDAAIFSEEIVIRDYLLSSISLHKEYAGVNINMNYAPREMGAIERDVFKTVHFLPGITSLDESASNITIRGSKSDQNLIIWEGAPIYDNGHIFGMISSINPFVVERLNVYKGVYNASYENRIGGVIDISLKDDIPDQLKVGIGSTITEFHAEVFAPLIQNKLALILSGRKATTSIHDDNITLERYGEKLFESSEILTEDEDGDEFLSDGTIDYYDVNSKIIYHPTKKLKTSLAYYNADNIFEQGYSLQSKNLLGYDSLNIKSSVLSNKIRYQWTDYSESGINITRSVYENDYRFLLDEALNTGAGFQRNNYNRVSDTQVKLFHRKKINALNLEIGYIFDRKNVDYIYNEATQFEQDIQEEGSQLGNFHHVFINSSIEHNQWLIDFGARTSYLSDEQSTHFAPRLSIINTINKNIKLKLSAGRFNQYVRQIENFSRSELNIENNIWLLGTDDIMKSNKISIGATAQKNNWILDLDIYHHHSIGVPVLTAGQQMAADVTNEGSMTSSGLELLIKKRWNRLNSALSYHFSQTHFDFPIFDDETFPSNNDQRHNLSILHQYQIKNWSIGTHYFLRSGLPYSEIDGLQFTEEEDESYYEAEIDEFNEERLTAQHRLDLSIGYRKLLFDKINLELQLSIFNLLDHKNTTSRSFILSDIEVSSEEPEIFEVEKHQLRRTPQLLFRITF